MSENSGPATIPERAGELEGILSSIPRVRLYEAILKRVEKLIAEEHYKPGDKLPSERELARVFQVSRSAVREAMTVLESAGVVDVRPGSGIFVREAPSCVLSRLQASAFLSGGESLLDLLEVRNILEVEGASMAASNAGEGHLQAIRSAHDELARAVAEGRLGADEDFAFHYAVAKAAGNMVLLGEMNAISGLYREALARRRSKALAVPGRPALVLSEHQKILEAIEKKDPEAARAAMKEHVDAVRQRLLEEMG